MDKARRFKEELLKKRKQEKRIQEEESEDAQTVGRPSGQLESFAVPGITKNQTDNSS